MTTPVRAGIYVRISDDREGSGLGVQRQEADCRELAATLGWPVAQVYTDNDVSAFDRRRRRLGWEALLADLAAGEIVGVLAWHVDRMYRRPADLDRVIDLIESRPAIQVRTVAAGPLDLSNPTGVAMAKVAAVFAEHESANRAARNRRKARELADAGKLSGGGTRPFGFEPDRLTIRESEATVIRELAAQLLSGASLRSLVVHLQTTGVRPVRADRWTQQVVVRMLRRPRIAGLRQHHDRIAGPAVWPAILDRQTWELVLAALGRRAEVRPESGWHYPRRYLLTGGVAVCQVCGTALVARPTTTRAPAMTCASGPPWHGCGHVRIMAEPLETQVTEAVLGKLEDRRLLARLASRAGPGPEVAGLIGAIERDEHRLAQLADALVEHADAVTDLLAASQRVKDRITKSRAQLARASSISVLRDLDPDTVRDQWVTWRAADVLRCRSLLSLVVERVIVGPALVRGLNRYDPRRVEIVPVEFSGSD